MRGKKPYRIDARQKEDLHAQIAELAVSYTPEWIFDPNDPDIGSVLAMLYADQMAGNVDRLNQVIEKYRVELVNLLNIGLLPAYPAEGVCVLNPIQDTIPGIDVPAGAKIFGGGSSEGAIIFETRTPLHVTSARIRDIIEVSGAFGRILPLLGNAAPAYPTGLERSAPPEDEDAPAVVRDIRLFDFEGKGVETHSLLLYHENVFDVPSRTGVLIEAFSPAGESLAETFAARDRYRFR
ncbi:MAG: hypothetical protein LBL63_07155, partial [Clostridiales Family XIII bacterium]|nr:hypothetical protein [Clostridiales Family XIII bacterium]